MINKGKPGMTDEQVINIFYDKYTSINNYYLIIIVLKRLQISCRDSSPHTSDTYRHYMRLDQKESQKHQY